MANQNIQQNSNHSTSQPLCLSRTLWDRQAGVISKRLKTLEYSLRCLAEDSQFEKPENHSIWFNNLRHILTVSSFWQCKPVYCTEDCDICCQNVLKMFLECHILNEKDNVGENYLAVWRILYTKIYRRYKEQQMKFQIAAKKQLEQETANNFPDDLQSLISDWDNLPENKTGTQLSPLNDEVLQHIVANLTDPQKITVEDPRELLATQHRGLKFSRPIKVIHPQQVKLTAQGLNNLKSINVRLGRVLPLMNQKRSILQNRTNLPLVQNCTTGSVMENKAPATAGRGVKRADPTRPLIVPRFPALIGRANPTERMILTPLFATTSHRPQSINQSRPGRPPLPNHAVPRPVGATSLLASPNVVSFHREFPPRKKTTGINEPTIEH